MGKAFFKDKSAFLIVLASVFILGASITVACLNRFTGIFTPKPTEKNIARNLDFTVPAWVEDLAELNVPSYMKDFSIYGAFTYLGEESTVTLVYSTRAELEAIRTYYTDILDDSWEDGKNGVASLGLRGKVKGRDVRVTNYFSEVANLIRVDIVMDGEYAALIREKIIAAFPQPALDAAPEIAALAAEQSGEGYVLYDNNAFALGNYVNVPIFSRAYPYNGTLAELKARIDALGETFRDPGNALIGEGLAEIKHAGYLYQIKPVEARGQIMVALMVQRIPDTGSVYS
jgi:hypothetical protein